ncbi:TatD family deoxyribonuclease [Robertkochia marina]|uniref:TatD family deoxyribonuclease n=1 Tax=Robertkochia marina TaxID=1227945 RepID=A0A4S3M4D5_9FLAO|nr:TatD family hydrolase [Robertkochia marina]THD69037.1 TatD family deoxyribonuclease [Robertkochia marina]TRZ44860.1 TatD family deoxyribonuclease [Robertkochia marina]
MILTDTHTHLYSEAFEEDRPEMLQRALDAGVERFFIPAIDASYIPSMLALQSQYPDHIYLMAGLHPTHVKENYLEELAAAEKMMNDYKVYGVGETGIDLYWDKSFLKEQQEAFRIQINWAKERGLPVIIHCRDAFEEVFEVLESEKDDRMFGIFHCFTGTAKDAQRAIDCNMKLGIGGVVTFKNGKIDQFLADFPIEHMVLETDSPYLSPTPYRGKRNESAYLLNVANKMAALYDLSLDEVAHITTENSRAVFGV